MKIPMRQHRRFRLMIDHANCSCIIKFIFQPIFTKLTALLINVRQMQFNALRINELRFVKASAISSSWFTQFLAVMKFVGVL